MSQDPTIKRQGVNFGPARSSAHLIVACVMFVGIVVAGILMDRAGRDAASIAATLSIYSAAGIAIVTALAKLTGVEQTANMVEKRTNGDMRAMVRDEVRGALAEAMPGKIHATTTEVVDDPL